MTSAMPSRRSAPTCPRRSRNPSSPASISRAAPSELRGQHPALGLVDVSWFVDDVVSRELLSVPGVQKVQRLGGVEREVRVALRADRLEALGLGADQVNAQLLRAQRPRRRAAGAEQSIRALGSAACRRWARRPSHCRRPLDAARRYRGPARWRRRGARTRARLDGQGGGGLRRVPRQGVQRYASRRAWSTPWNNCAASTPTSTSSWCPRPWPIRWPATTRPS